MKYFLILTFLLGSFSVTANFQDYQERKVKYRTYFGKCPSKVAGALTLTLIKEFEKTWSLKSVKELIVKEKLDEKHFLSSYQINFQPNKKLLSLNYDCPEALMKVQVYRESGYDSYEAILVENGKLFDPTYEVILRSEGKLKKGLPYLAIPEAEVDKDVHYELTDLMLRLKPEFREKISEAILDEEGSLTMILSIGSRPSSAFLGPEEWAEKVEKLIKIVKYMNKKSRLPSIINLTNSKKVVVKFSS